MGGEITWECIKTGPNAGFYVFQVKVFRDCQGVPINTAMSLDVHNVPGMTVSPGGRGLAVGGSPAIPTSSTGSGTGHTHAHTLSGTLTGNITTTGSLTGAVTASGTNAFSPYVVVNYIIKH